MAICPFCNERPLRSRTRGGLPRRDCGEPPCRTASRKACEAKCRASYHERLRLGLPVRRSVWPDLPSRRRVRSDADIEAAMEQNRQARIAARRAGDPQWSVDGWSQRPGRSSMDGECRVVAAAG
jgi:hypothetical protein